MTGRWLKAGIWMLSILTAVCSLLYAAPAIAELIDDRVGSSMAPGVQRLAEPVIGLYPWTLALPVALAVCIVALIFHRIRQRRFVQEDEQRHRSNFQALARDEPGSFDGALASGALDADRPPTAVTAHPLPAQVFQTDDPVESVVPEAELGLRAPAPRDTESRVIDEPPVAGWGDLDAGDDADPVAAPPNEPDEVRPDQNSEAARVSRFLSDEQALEDLTAWVGSLLDSATKPFEDAVADGSFDVGIDPASARVLYIDLLRDEAENRLGSAIRKAETAGIDREALRKLIDR